MFCIGLKILQSQKGGEGDELDEASVAYISLIIVGLG